MNVLVTGGAGYIGSHAVRKLRAAGASVVVVDNLGLGHRAAVPSDVPFFQLDLRHTVAVREVLQLQRIDCVMHFAALAQVGESVAEPLRYYSNNVAGTLSLLERHAVDRRAADCVQLDLRGDWHSANTPHRGNDAAGAD